MSTSKAIKGGPCTFSITLLKPYRDTDQNTYRAHNRNKYHHVYSAHLSNRLIAAGLRIMSSRKREGMLCQRDTNRSWAQCADHRAFPLVEHLSELTFHPGCISIWNDQLAPCPASCRAMSCFSRGPCRACFLWFLRWGWLCSQSFPHPCPLSGLAPARWRARSALRACPPWEAPP